MILLRVQAVVPWSILNYFLGLTSCTATDFLISMVLGMLPGTISFIIIGSNYKSISDLVTQKSHKTKTEYIFGAMGLIGIILFAYLLTRETKIQLKKILDQQRQINIEKR